jgi:hypothetical protein
MRAKQECFALKKKFAEREKRDYGRSYARF